MRKHFGVLAKKACRCGALKAAISRKKELDMKGLKPNLLISPVVILDRPQQATGSQCWKKNNTILASLPEVQEIILDSTGLTEYLVAYCVRSSLHNCAFS
jgi:hypothetical protein